MPQWLARADHTLARLRLERLFLGWHKFCHFRVWYRDELSKYMKDVLLDPRTRQRPYLRGSRLEEMVNNHIRGNRNYTREIHKVLSAELTQRLLIEQK
jgi:asparagine synthase (glutamine-hydrolysing)